MEIMLNKSISTSEIQFQNAKEKVRSIKSFYINLSLYCILIPVIIGINLQYVPEYHWFWFSMIGWGTGVIFHGLSAFDVNPFMQNNWEKGSSNNL